MSLWYYGSSDSYNPLALKWHNQVYTFEPYTAASLHPGVSVSLIEAPGRVNVLEKASINTSHSSLNFMFSPSSSRRATRTIDVRNVLFFRWLDCLLYLCLRMNGVMNTNVSVIVALCTSHKHSIIKEALAMRQKRMPGCK